MLLCGDLELRQDTFQAITMKQEVIAALLQQCVLPTATTHCVAPKVAPSATLAREATPVMDHGICGKLGQDLSTGIRLTHLISLERSVSFLTKGSN